MDFQTFVYMDYNRDILEIQQAHKSEYINPPDYFASMIILNGYLTYNQVKLELKRIGIN